MKESLRKFGIAVFHLLFTLGGESVFIWIILLFMVVPIIILFIDFFQEPEVATLLTIGIMLLPVLGFLIPIIRSERDDIKKEIERRDAERYAATPEGQEQARREEEERRRDKAEKKFHSLETYPFEFDHKHRMVRGTRGMFFNDRANSLTCEFFDYCKTRYENEEQQRQKAELEAELEAERRAETERT